MGHVQTVSLVKGHENTCTRHHYNNMNLPRWACSGSASSPAFLFACAWYDSQNALERIQSKIFKPPMAHRARTLRR
eukprot:322561-Chlamydomonas_euryale.AAC.15